MRRGRGVRFLTAALLGGLLLTPLARAEDTKGKWQFGFGLSYFSTTDSIRSNADIAVASGLPAGNGLPPVTAIDPRPDINLLNQASIADDFKLDVSGSYGLTRWLAIEAAAGYQRSAVGNIEYFTHNETQPLGVPSPVDNSSCGPDGSFKCTDYHVNPGSLQKANTSSFLQVGQLTKIPVQLSSLIRFRPESPFDPYIGLGVGYIFTNIEDGSDFKEKQQHVAATLVTNAYEGEITTRGGLPTKISGPGFFPTPPSAQVRDSFEWHAIGGVDYYINERVSFYIDGRYTWTSGSVDIRTDGAHEVLFGISDQGRLLTLKQTFDPAKGPTSGPYLWEDVGLHDNSLDTKGNFSNFISCDPTNSPGVPCGALFPNALPTDPNSHLGRVGLGDRLFETEDHDLNGSLTINSTINENDGIIDVYPPGPIPTFRDSANVLHQDPNEAIGHFFCPQCVPCDATHTTGCLSSPPVPSSTDLVRALTEDQNYNNYMDRFLLYGVDICTTPQGVGNPVCKTPPLY